MTRAEAEALMVTMICMWCHREGTRGFTELHNTKTGEPYYICQGRKACGKRKVRRLKATFPDWGKPGY